MDDEGVDRTSSTLLRRLRDPGDVEAWNNFHTRYGPRIRDWCRRRGLQEADVDDVTQQVLLSLVKAVRNLKYDRKKMFRAYLKTVSQHAVYAFWERQARG